MNKGFIIVLLVLLSGCNDDNTSVSPALPSVSDCEQSGCEITGNISTQVINIGDSPVILSGNGSVTLTN